MKKIVVKSTTTVRRTVSGFVATTRVNAGGKTRTYTRRIRAR